jgi:sucrose-6-phosphate hydrolase SacC (GH32 family)
VKGFKIFLIAFLTTLSLTAQIRNELYRPAFHYSPGSNWMGDPNGLVYYNGKYHMFYQYNPSGMQPGNSSWGHAVSSDLINWEEKPIAIPAQNGVMAFSGSVVVDWKNTSGFGVNGKPPLVAIYTGASNVQDQRIAYSNDEGLTWINYSENPVISSNSNQFRDPKVIWYEPGQKWIMIISTGDNKSIHFYSSLNLKSWTLMQVFGLVGNMSGFWECPDLLKLPVDNDTNNMKWVLVHSVTPTAQYFIGDFNGQNFNWQPSQPNGILIDDFESNNYNNWTVTGTAFNTAPAVGATNTSGYLGNKLIYSYSNGNEALGKLVSSDFTIQKKYINFLIGGGYHPNGEYIKLVVNGETVKSSTGRDEDLLKWRNWDVSSLIGKTAHIEIVDSVSEAWGHINVDHIIQSDVIYDNINYGQVDYGKDFYALQSFYDMPGERRIWIAWMNNWNYAAQIPTTPWKGIMSIPREVKLETHNGQIKLVQKPIEELKVLRRDSLFFHNKNLSVINNSVGNLSLKQFELEAKIAVENKKGFSLKFKKNGLQYSEFVFDFINKEIRFDRSKYAGGLIDPNFRDLQVAPLLIENGAIDLHLFVDNCSAELFTAGGQVVVSNQIFPDSTANRIVLTALDQDILFDEFDIWNFEKQSFLPPDTTATTDTTHLKDKLFRVYPNPVANNGITIKIKDDMLGKIKFKLFDVNGRLISEFQPSTNSIIIPRNKLTTGKGIFFLKGSTGQFTRVEKLLVL